MNSQNSSSDSGVLKYPNNEKEAANLVRVDRWVGLSQFAIQDDIQYLMLHFKSVCYVTYSLPFFLLLKKLILYRKQHTH